MTDPYAAVRPKPGSLLDRCLQSISNPRKHRWNAYLRACRAIPKDSPVAGSTSWERINARRMHLIDCDPCGEVYDPEFEALQRVANEYGTADLAAHCFLLARLVRRLAKIEMPE
jgi:hypothetical protein